MKTVFIVNSPIVRRCATEWRRVEDHISKSRRLAGDIRMTEFHGQAAHLTREALVSGYQLVVAVGGDGTVNEVLNGLFQDGVGPDRNVTLGTIPLGSGCDLARGLGVSKRIPEALETLESMNVSRIDVGRVDFVNLRGQRETRSSPAALCPCTARRPG